METEEKKNEQVSRDATKTELTVDNFAKELGKGADEAISELKKMFSDIKTNASPMANKAKEEAVEVFNDIKKESGPVLEESKKEAKKAIDDVKNMFNNNSNSK